MGGFGFFFFTDAFRLFFLTFRKANTWNAKGLETNIPILKVPLISIWFLVNCPNNKEDIDSTMHYTVLVKMLQKYLDFVFGQAVSDTFPLCTLSPLGRGDGK